MSRTPLVQATASSIRGFAFAVLLLLACSAAVPATALTLRGTVHTEKPEAPLAVRVWALGEALAARPALLEAPLATAQTAGGTPFALDVGDAIPPLLVDVLAEGHLGARYLVTRPEEATLPAVWLPAGQQVRLRVTRAGKPEPDARVEGSTSRPGMQDRGWGVWLPTLPSQRTDSKGEVRWWVPVGGGVQAVAAARDGRWGTVSRTAPLGGTVQLKLDSRALRVLVQDAHGEPVAGIEVAARTSPLGVVSTTAEDGAAVVQVPADVDGDVVVWGDALAGRALVRKDASGPVVIIAAPRRTLDLAWTGPTRLMAYPTWLPLAIDRVSLRWATGGRMTLPWLDPGGQVQLWAPGFSQVDQQVNSADQPIAAALQAGVRVEGIIQDNEHKPLAGVPVWPYVPRFRGMTGMGTEPGFLERTTLAWGVSDARGRFVLPPLSGGTLRLRATRPGYPAVQHGPVEAAAGSTATVTLTFESGTTLDVQVADSDSRPLAGSAVEVYARDREEQSWVWRPSAFDLERQEATATVTADGEGSARAVALPAGKAWVLLRMPGFVPRVLEADIPPEGVDLGVQTLEPAVDVTGRVVNEAGKGLADAEVRLITVAGMGGSAVARSDADGQFVVADQPRSGELSLAASVKGYVMAGLVKVVLPPPGEVVLRMRQARVLTGRVVDAESQSPLSDASVSAGTTMERTTGMGGMIMASGRSARGRTDERGEFRLEDLEPATLTLTATAQGYQRQSQQVEMPPEGDPAPVLVALRKGFELRGRVLEASGQPAAGVQVTASQAETDMSMRMMRSGGLAQSGPDGAFSIGGLGSGKHEVSAQGPDGESAQTLAEPGGPEVVLRLERAGSVQGRVKGSEGVRVAGLRVSMYGRGRYEARTDESGAFSLEKVAPGTLHLMVEGHAVAGGSLEVKVEPGRTTTVEVVLERTGSVTGTVRGLSATELEACEIFGLGSAVARPGPDGIFRAEGVREGRVIVRAAVRLDGRQRSAPVEVKSGETATVELDFAEGVTVSGAVRRAGAAVSSLLVAVLGSGGGGSTTTDADGRYVVEGVPRGQTEVSVRDLQGRLLAARKLDIQRDTVVDLVVGRGGVDGRVVAARTGAPVSGALVKVVREGEEAGTSRAVSTDGNGVFRCSELEPGVYRVQASADGYSTGEVTLTVGEATVETTLRLEPEQGVELILRRADGQAVGEVLVMVFRGEILDAQQFLVCDAQGRATLKGLPPGSYQIAIWGSWGGQATVQVPGPSVAIALREMAGLTIDTPLPQGGAPWRVRVIDAATGLVLPILTGRGLNARLGWVETLEGQLRLGAFVGSSVVEAVAPDGQTHTKTVQVAPRSTTTVRFP